MKDKDFQRAHFVFWSRRLVKEIVQQHESSPRKRWRVSFSATMPHGVGVNISRDALDCTNEFALIRSATQSVKEITGPISQLWGWDEYVTGELELELGVVCVHAGWENGLNIEIAAMRAVLTAPEGGTTLVAMFGSASNYRKLNGNEGQLAEKPSDVDGLYAILDRTREPADPKIGTHFLDRELSHSAESRAAEAENLLDGPRFKAFRKNTFEVLIKVFARVEDDSTDYETIVLGTPIWVAERAATR